MSKNQKTFLIVIGFAAALGLGAYLYMWNLARHTPSLIHENGQLPAVQAE